MSPIVFFFPYPTVGGVSVLFLRLARRLSKGRNVFLMDLPSGYMARNLPELCSFIPSDRPDLIPKNAIVVFQSVPLWRIKYFEFFPSTARVLFWNLHPYNLSPRLIHKGSRLESLFLFNAFNRFFSLPRKRRIRALCTLLIAKGALFFMDRENRAKTNDELGADFPEIYLPITTEDAPAVPRALPIPNTYRKIKMGWVGRLEDFKIPILLHTLTRLDAIPSLEIEFDVVGDGPQASVVREHVENLDRLSVHFKGRVSHAELDKVLSNQHVVFAMGTSALDSARLGIPTFCLDYSYESILGNYRFRLLRSSEGFNVAEEITPEHMEPTSSLEDSLHTLLERYALESRLAYDYWKTHHSPETVAALFTKCCDNSSLTFDDVRQAELHVPDLVTKAVCRLDPRKLDCNGLILR